MLAIVLLAALPLASLSGAFQATEQRSAESGGLRLHVRYPKRTLYREDVKIDVEVESTSHCERAVVEGLAAYLDGFEALRTVPATGSTRRLYDGAISAGERIAVQVQGRPIHVGVSRATLSLNCGRQRGPRVELITAVFP